MSRENLEDVGNEELFQMVDEFSDVGECQEELAYMIKKLEEYDCHTIFSKINNEEWAEGYDSLSSEDGFSIEEFARELLETYMEDGGMSITDFDGPYTPGDMELFKEFFDNEVSEMLDD